METAEATRALAALAQETRLSAFRMLVRAGPSGVPAGDIARHLGVPAATLSFHLSQLERAGLVTAHRRSRQILYAPRLERMRGLLAFMLEDCCNGHPEICAAIGAPAAARADDRPAQDVGDRP